MTAEFFIGLHAFSFIERNTQCIFRQQQWRSSSTQKVNRRKVSKLFFI